ncbi:MAG: hypothetical protein EOP07_15395 [Proteobacteria bacterium]|nr:MAG: hypothetical protein EOP07_15395 [Pseudomonadota bacterium]
MISLRALSLLLLFVTTNVSFAQTSQWPAGGNVCQGSWKYNEYDSCESPDHGPDQNRPLPLTLAGYGTKPKSCFHGDHFSRVVDTPIVEIRRNDTGWDTPEVQAICNAQSTTVGFNAQERIAGITIGHVNQGEECRQREKFPNAKKCRKWTKKLYYSCHFVINKKEFGENANECGGFETDTNKPLYNPQTFANTNKRSSSCGSSQLVTAPSMTDATALKTESWRFGFACSTGDDLADGTIPDARQKYSSLLDLLVASKNTAEEAIIIKNLQLLMSTRESLLEDSQKINIKKIADQNLVSQEVSIGTVFDSNEDCAVKNDGSGWYCKTKKVSLGLKNTNHLHDLANFTAISYRLGYVFQCSARSGSVSVKSTLNSNAVQLSSNTDGSEQLLVVPFNPKDGLASLDFTPDANFAPEPNCIFKVTINEIDVDENLLKNSVQAQLFHYGKMKETANKLQSAQQLPEKYSTIGKLKEDLETKFVEGVFSCRSVSSTLGKKPEEVCPEIESSKAFCEQKPNLVEPELQMILDGLKGNSCLLKDLEAALPSSSPCLSNGNVQCLNEVSQAADSLGQALEKIRSDLQKVSGALSQEMTRVEKTSVDAFENLKRIKNDIDAMISETHS